MPRPRASHQDLQHPQPTGRARPLARVVEGASWWRISNAAGDGGAPARVDIYDEIGWYGVTASAFVAQLNEITAGSIELHINSPGGDVYDGIAIYNALLDHPADVEVRVDGLAASAASFIAQAGDRVVMGRNSEMMIHDALGMTIGNAADHRAMAEMLDAASDNLASIYAARAGNGGVKSWRKRMEDETWYTADEAVAAGLADSVSATPRRRGEAAASAEPVWDLSVFKHSNRQEAGPPPGVRPRAEEAKCSKCGAELTDAQKAKGFCSECDESLEDAVTDAKCPDCGADVPDGATSCPDCGASMREDESDLTDLLDSLPELDVKAMHLAMIDAADEAGLDVDTTALRASLEGDWTFDPDVFRATLLEELEAPAHAVEPPPVPTPTTIRIDAVADALRGALQP